MFRLFSSIFQIILISAVTSFSVIFTSVDSPNGKLPMAYSGNALAGKEYLHNPYQEFDSFSLETKTPAFQDNKYGYGFFSLADLTFKDEWESGANHITEFSSSSTDFSKFYIVVENFEPTYESTEGWLDERESYFMGTLESFSDVMLDGVAGKQRIYHSKDSFHLAQYYLTNNKIYTLNIGPLSEPVLPPGFEKVIENNFHWLEGNYSEPVPILAQKALDISDDQLLLGPPTLQFPFCGTWNITGGYYNQSPGHPNNQWNAYALDFIDTDGNTFQDPVYAAHNGSVSTWWDSTGGGNAIRVLYSDTNYETIYLHLFDYTVTSGSVASGEKLGRVDCTGTSCSGSHIHFAYLQGGSGNWQSIPPEPMSGATNFAPGQNHTRNCGGCCGCSLIAQANRQYEESDLLALFGEASDMSVPLETVEETVAMVAEPPEYDALFLTDVQLEAYGAMSEADIRAFLVEKGSYFSQLVLDVDGVSFDAAAVIAQVAQAANDYQINPQVLLATMQKESSMVQTGTRPSDAIMANLMGCGSSSTARGQLQCAAQKFRSYHDDLANGGATVSGWQVGVAKATVDGVVVMPASKAVAGQFTYTPYAGAGWGGDFGGVQLFHQIWHNYGFHNSTAIPRDIMIEAGHGNGDNGSSSCDGTHFEADVTIGVANILEGILEAAGHNVTVVRKFEMDDFLGDAFVSLHNDWCPAGNVSGYKVSRFGGMAGTGTVGDGSPSDLLVESIWDEYGSVTGLPQDIALGHFTPGMLYYYALNPDHEHGIHADTPGAIIEMAWWSGDEDILLNHQDDMACGVAKGIAAFFGETINCVPSPPCCGCAAAVAGSEQNANCDEPSTTFLDMPPDSMSLPEIAAEPPVLIEWVAEPASPQWVEGFVADSMVTAEVMPPLFTWSPAIDEDGEVTGYLLYWGDDPEGIGDVLVADTSFIPVVDGGGEMPASYYLRIAAQDDDENLSEWQTVATWQYDPIAPTGSLAIGGAGGTVGSLNVRLDLAVDDEGSGVAEMRFSKDGQVWTDWQGYTPSRRWQFDGVGSQVVYGQVRDNAGNLSPVMSTTVIANLNIDLPSSANFEVGCSVFGIGGGTKSSGSYTVHSTTGQAHSTSTLQSGSYQVRSGFWNNCGTAPVAPFVTTALSANGEAIELTFTHHGNNTLYEVYRSNMPYFDPSELMPVATITPPTNTFSSTVGIGDTATNYYWIIRAITNGLYADSNGAGEFDFAIVPGS